MFASACDSAENILISPPSDADSPGATEDAPQPMDTAMNYGSGQQPRTRNQYNHVSVKREPRSGSPLRNSSEPVPHFKLPTPARAPLGTFSSPVPHFRLFCGRGPTSKFSVFHGLLSALVLARRHPIGFPSFRSSSPTLNFSPRHGPHLELFPRPSPTSDFFAAEAPLPTLGARAPHLRRLRIPAVDDEKTAKGNSSLTFFLRTAV